MNIVFLGTPSIARDCLEKIFNSKHKILAVVTNLDKPKGRGNKIFESPVKTFAKNHNILCLQYKSISKEGVQTLKSLKPDALVLVAFGQILSAEILNVALPINLHGSLLPALRGPSPIQSAILSGLTETGLTVMKMASTVDSGDILLQEKIKIEAEDTSKSLFEKAGKLGGELLVKALDLIEKKQDFWQKQDHKNATFTEKLTKQNAKLDFKNSASQIVNKVRAYYDDPVAYLEINDSRYKIYSAKVMNFDAPNAKIGEVVCADKRGLILKACDKFVEICELSLAGGKRLKSKDFLNGNKVELGAVAK